VSVLLLPFFLPTQVLLAFQFTRNTRHLRSSSSAAGYCQFHQAKGVTVRFTESAADPMGGSGPRWIIRCTLSSRDAEDSRTFPLADEPADGPQPAGSPGHSTPSFGRKRDAKQYAAKCCVEWLQMEGRMPGDGINVSFSKMQVPREAAAPTPLSVPPPPSPPPVLPSPASKRARAEDRTPSPRLSWKGNASLLPLPPTPPSLPPPPAAATTAAVATAAAAPAHVAEVATASHIVTKKSRSTSSSALDLAWARDDRISATSRVAVLCKHLGLNIPTYRMTLSGPRGNLWTGAPDFGVDNMLVPHDLGCISLVWGKEQAKQKMAEELLPFLLELYVRRQAKAKDLILMDGDVGMTEAEAEWREPLLEQ